MVHLPPPKSSLNKREGGILSLSGMALLDLLRAVLDRRVPFRFSAHGSSMWPFIKDGDVITVSQIDMNAIRVGEVVAFVNPCNERLAVHRIVGRNRDTWLIKGDNKPEEDGWISSGRILGRVTRVERADQHIRLGLGGERILIAFLSRGGWLVPLDGYISRIYHLLLRGSSHE